MKKNRIRSMIIIFTFTLIVPVLLAGCKNKTKDSDNENKNASGLDSTGNEKLDDSGEDNSNDETSIGKVIVKDIGALAIADAVLSAFDEDSLPSFSLKLYGVKEDDENYFIPGLASTLINGTNDPVEEFEYAIDYAFYIPKGALVFEIDVVKVSDSIHIQAVEDMLLRRLALKDDGNVRLYNPEEVVLLEAGEVVTIGNYIILLVTSDNETAKEAINKVLFD